jgi:hypothetical protein
MGEEMKILRDNLLSALKIAVFYTKKEEKELNYTQNSCLVDGWIQVKEALEKGEDVFVE